MEILVDLDKSLFIFLNSLGLEFFDSLWMFITDKRSSIPLYLFLNNNLKFMKLKLIFLLVFNLLIFINSHSYEKFDF